ncbi:histidine kinase [Desulfitobacterium sp. LBE]|uniref:histidine kinase n=1 Tax=Desulfitobacterium hafniense (strain DSM 10664 / DCB-2) TaxID=272564 RepID=B8FRJ4_DESHD|nr:MULTISPECIES: ATP-binding protein [Desulfitobacterium]ACL21754.1 histidine kinase [Desulfitobacterium hafniense DCB-2]TWH60472.1 histidine kinase [Desulfitobacterium sp. LBE]
MNFDLRPRSISMKLWAAITALILAVLGGLGVTITLLFGDFYFQQTLDTLGKEVEEISHYLGEQPNWSQRLFAIDEIRLSSDTQMVVIDRYSEIIAIKGGNVAASFGTNDRIGWGDVSGEMSWLIRSLYPSDFLSRTDIAEVLAGKVITIKAIPRNKTGQAMLIAAAPLGNPSEAIVVLGTSPAPVQDSINAFRRMTLYVSLAAVVLATLVSLVFARQVTRPLALMQKGASQMANGDFQPITGVRSRDELGELADVLNSMGESLKNHMTWLSEERNLLLGIVEGISDGVIMLDGEGEILYTNEPAKALWQGSGSEEESSERKETLMAFLRESMEGVEIDKKIHFNLDTQVLQVAMATTQFEDGKQGYVAVLRDITASLRAEKERRDFMASVTHELRTPLHLIQGYLEAIQDGVIAKEEQTEHIDLVLEEAKRLAKLVMELQELDRFESWKNFEKKEIDLAGFIQELGYRFQGRADELGIHLQMDNGKGVIHANRDRLLQVFINLIENAFRHTPEGKSVYIRIIDSEEHIQFNVEDQGEGIPPQALPHIFDRFYRVDKSRSRKEGGMGLGLSIVMLIVEAHNGEIKVESEVGKGTTFKVILPK